MKKHFIISSILALAMGIAQAQTQQSPAPMQSGQNDPRQGQQQTGVAPAAAQGMGPGGVNDQAAAQSFKGCLNGSAGSWTLTSDKGKTATVSGADNQLSPYRGQEVRIQGVQTNDGSITVSSIDKVSDACANQSASNMGSQSSSTNQNDMNSQSSSATNSTSQSTTTTQPSSSADTSSQSAAPATSTTPDNSTTTMNGQNSATSSSTAPGATTPPVSNQTPANSVGSGQTTQSSAQTPGAQTPSTSTNDQNTASSTSTNNQNSTGGQNATSSDQSSNQGVRHYSDMDQSAGNTGNKLPQTASPLPLLGFLGLGSLAAGLMGRRKK